MRQLKNNWQYDLRRCILWNTNIGHSESEKLDLRACNNTIEGNYLRDLRIRKPDKYSNNHAEGRMFATSPEGSATGHIWLGVNTKGNTIKTINKEAVIDQGERNIVLAN